LSPDIGWHAGDLLRQFDRIAGSSIFTQLYEEQIKSEAFPDLTEVYRLYSLQIGAEGQLTLGESAPRQADRDAIIAPSAPASGTDVDAK